MTDVPRMPLTRRRFLALGTAAAALPASGPLRAGARTLARGAGGVRVGYVPATAGLAGLDELYLGWRRGPASATRLAGITDAADAPAAGQVRTWRITLHGLQVPEGGSLLESLALEILYRRPGAPGDSLPFRAWEGSPARGDMPRALRFTAGADALEGIALRASGRASASLRALLGGAVASGRASRADGGFAAAPGLYLVAAPDAGGRPADWGRLRARLAERDGRVAGATLCATDARPAAHDCLILTLTPA